MAGGLVGLLDDVAALAKLAAASIDDVGVAAGRASMKAAGVVVDDAAVTPKYVSGLAAERELPIIRKIATASMRNKLFFIVPVVLLLSEFLPWMIEILLLCGGTFLCYEGAHKVIHAIKKDDHDHDEPAVIKGPEAEKETVAGAIRTDFILSAEIMVISLKSILEDDAGLFTRSVSLIVVAIVITIAVYGVVALIVKMDDIGLRLAERDDESSKRLGRGLVNGMPKLLTFLSVVGTAAMLWVGGHILLAAGKDLGWKWPYETVHDFAHAFDIGAIGGFLEWLANTAVSAVIGLAVGFVVVTIIENLPFGPGKKADEAHAAAH